MDAHMKKKLMFIINPNSGKGAIKTAIFDILSVFSAAGYAVTTYITQKGGDACDFAKLYAKDYDVVVCSGGDGTLSEVISGLVTVENAPHLGYIPMGTANDVASTFKLSRNPKTAAERIVNGTPTPMDIGRFEDHYFSYISAFGAFTEVSYSTPQEKKKLLGHFAYILEGMASLPSISAQHAVVEYDEGIIEGDFIFGAVTNSTSVAGLVKLSPENVCLNDGYFEVLLIKYPKKITDLGSIINNVLRQSYDPEHVHFLHTKKIKFTFDKPVAWTRDGEDGGKYQTASAENIFNAINLII